MARRKPTTSSPTRDHTAANRTAIIVALIGLIGTLGAALIAVVAGRAPQSTAGSPTPSAGLAATSAPAAAATLNGQNAPTQADCLASFMAEIEPTYRDTLVVGGSQHDIYFPSEALTTATTMGPFGLTLQQQAQAVAGVKFIFTPASRTFEITSVVDGTCQPVADLTNLTRSRPGNVLQNWDALGLGLPGGLISLRFGLQEPDHFRLSTRASQ